VGILNVSCLEDTEEVGGWLVGTCSLFLHRVGTLDYGCLGDTAEHVTGDRKTVSIFRFEGT
jgi:hypothetical protein